MKKIYSLAVAALLSISMLVPGAASASGYVYTNSTGKVFDSGGSFSRYVTHYMGKDRSAVNVQLSGWEFDYSSKDHHIDRASMRIESVHYNRSTGYVSFYIRGAYDDKNDDDDYYWTANYTILTLF